MKNAVVAVHCTSQESISTALTKSSLENVTIGAFLHSIQDKKRKEEFTQTLLSFLTLGEFISVIADK